MQQKGRRAQLGRRQNPYTSGNVELLLTHCRVKSGVAAKAVGVWWYVAEQLQVVPVETGKGAVGVPKGGQHA